MKRHAAIVAALWIVAAGIQWWCVRHSVTPALDSVRYVGLAQRIDRDGYLTTLRNDAEHPFFPSLVWAAHRIVASISADTPEAWAMAAQGASTGMLLLTVVPVWLLLRQLVDLPSAAAGTLFFCTMTEVAFLGADGLSDSSQLFFLAVALAALARYWRIDTNVQEQGAGAHRSPHWLALTGLSTGTALLARPEALVLLPTVVFMLIWFQGHLVWQQPWRRLTWGIGLMSLGVLLALVPYLVASDSLSPRAAWSRLLGRDPVDNEPAKTAVATSVAAGPWQLTNGERMAFPVKESTTTSRFSGYASAAIEYAKELPEVLQYWIGGLALFGLWRRRHNSAGPFTIFALAYFAIHSLAVMQHAAGVGYLSPRHLMPLLLLSLAPAGLGALEVGRWLAEQMAARQSRPAWLHYANFASASVVLLAVGACLPRTLSPVHASRHAHRQAASWLAQQAPQPGAVLDTRGLTGLYSGRTTFRYDAAKAAFSSGELAYVVVEQRELEFKSGRSRTLNELLESAAEPTVRFDAPSGKAQDAVLVFRWHPARFARNLHTSQLTN